MKTCTVIYYSYEGRVVRTEVDVDDDATEEDVKLKAIEEDSGYGDGILKIIDVEMF